MGPQGGPGPFSHFFNLFGRFRGREAFQRFPGARTSVLTKYQPKRTHLDPIHHIFHDFGCVSLHGTPMTSSAPRDARRIRPLEDTLEF